MNPAAIRHAKAAIMNRLYHAVWSTKRRRPILVGDIGDCIGRSVREIATRCDIEILEFAMEYDHVHILLRIHAGQSLPSVMHQIKGASARVVFLEFPELKLDLGSASFWQKSYGRWVPEDQIAVVSKYIRTQDDRPIRHY
jgi:putative transposase